MSSYDKSIKLKQGHKYSRMQQFPTLDKNQIKLLSQYSKHPNVQLPQTSQSAPYNQGLQFLQSILSQDPRMMQQFEAPYMRQFNEQIMPSISEQFAGAGALGSSGFQNAAAGAGTDLMERLASLRSGLGMDAAQQAFGYAQLPFQEALQNQGLNLSRAQLALGTQPFGYADVPSKNRSKGFFESAGPGIMEMLPQLLAMFF